MSHADLVDILEPSPRRIADVQELPGRVIDADNKAKLDAVRAKFGNRVQCQYFGECSGCQVRRSLARTSSTRSCAQLSDARPSPSLHSCSTSPSPTTSSSR